MVKEDKEENNTPTIPFGPANIRVEVESTGW